MTHVIGPPCFCVKDASCVNSCPVDCIREGKDQYFINPDECIDCTHCVDVCPVGAILYEDDVPDNWMMFLEKARDFFRNK